MQEGVKGTEGENSLLLHGDSKEGKFWTVSEELQALPVEEVRESSIAAVSQSSTPSSTDPSRGTTSRARNAYSKDFQPLSNPSKALRKKMKFKKKKKRKK
ncbi:hypothetical protein llap_10614 [Limosa lapponica baueri]|uniref:Uncharacterized protein n=1 Tax=Limosa lapponica baueri TaxID=1758121 RepID=A0A2I0TZ94_LIMLA|nr:hypothetical protein llap_10614 [Limosa lapponica baueri]